MVGSTRQPRVRRNRWDMLHPPELGHWEPTRTVSVVVPAYQAHRTLPLTLAALAEQSYPQHLLEVVVVDDGSDPALDLPERRPDNTTLVRTPASWGRAQACRTGAEAASGEVLHWLDADMLPFRHEVEAQMRWHHLVDYAVVLGDKTFVDPDEWLPTPAEAADAVREDRADVLFDGRWQAPHTWVEDFYARRSDLRASAWRGYRVHVGATASVGHRLYDEAGGMSPDLKLGEDIELGHRLGLRGGFFVPERAARSWHLGRSQVMRRQEQVNRYNAPFLADRVSDLRQLRTAPRRSWTVPFVDVVVDTDGRTLEEVRHTVDGLLDQEPYDLRCLLVGPWDRLDDRRRTPLEDPLLEARLVQAEYAGEQRARLVTHAPSDAFPAMYLCHWPAGWAPRDGTLAALVDTLQKSGDGLATTTMPDGRVLRLERTAALARARHLQEVAEDLDAVVEEISGVAAVPFDPAAFAGPGTTDGDRQDRDQPTQEQPDRARRGWVRRRG